MIMPDRSPARFYVAVFLEESGAQERDAEVVVGPGPMAGWGADRSPSPRAPDIAARGVGHQRFAGNGTYWRAPRRKPSRNATEPGLEG